MSQQEQAPSLQHRVEQLGHALALIVLAALSSPISQHVLAPVYGSLPSSINHQIALPFSFLLAFILHGIFITDLPRRQKWIQHLPLIAVLVPTIENIALAYSEQLGIMLGPVFGGLVSCHAIVISAAFAAADSLEKIKLGSWSSGTAASLANASIALLPFIFLERFAAAQLRAVLAGSTILAPAELQLIVAGASSLLVNPGEAYLLLTGLIALSTWLFDPHGKGLYSERIVNQALSKSNWTILDRSWSTTGYVSVLESTTEAYRVMRCDHSLLGGQWLVTDTRREQGWKVDEPIYSVFTMLEAVRLIEDLARPVDKAANALVVGLGIGTAPAAMIAHGIPTTIIELDPTVYEYAIKYFGLPANHTPIIEDAVAWVHEQSSKDIFDRAKFDYIIHDVFTGGAEPLPLFTATFLRGLRSLLSPNGVAAINYAGQIDDPLTRLVLNTIDMTFDRQCEIYGDDPPANENQASFNNFIVFCRNTAGPIRFRKPTAADFQDSLIRKDHLLPKPAQRIEFPARAHQSEAVLDSKDLLKWRKSQAESAKRHWQVMRTVLPAAVWESY